MSADGTWYVEVDTPMGKQAATYELHTQGQTLTGVVTSSYGTAQLSGGRVRGNDLSWSIQFPQPYPMSLDFKTRVNGDTMSGSVTAGQFGTAPVVGRRR